MKWAVRFIPKITVKWLLALLVIIALSAGVTLIPPELERHAIIQAVTRAVVSRDDVPASEVHVMGIRKVPSLKNIQWIVGYEEGRSTRPYLAVASQTRDEWWNGFQMSVSLPSSP